MRRRLALALAAVFAGLMGYALYRTGILAPETTPATPSQLSREAADDVRGKLPVAVEAPDQSAPPPTRAPGEAIRIYFYPGSFELFKRMARQHGAKTTDELYDLNAAKALEEIIGRTSRTPGTARIVIEGHSDSSMRGEVPAEAARALSLARANAVKQVLERRFAQSHPTRSIRFAVTGAGWSQPASKETPPDHALSRRVDVRVE